MNNFFTFLLIIYLLPNFYNSQTTHTVYASNYEYSPPSLTIEAGDSVKFINDAGYHDVVVTSGPEILTLPACSGPCSIGTLKFNIVGEYEYICSIGYHASLGMVGNITVNPASAKLSLQGVMDLYGSNSDYYSGTDGKAIHLKANGDISDLSEYSLDVISNGSGSFNPDEYILSGSANSGDDILVYRVGSGDSSDFFFQNYFGDCYSEFEIAINSGSSWPSGNGDDPVALFYSEELIDSLTYDGNAIISGSFSGDPYADSWAYRLEDGSWEFGGNDCDEDDGTYSVYTSGCPYPICENSILLQKTYVPDDNFEAYLEANAMGDGIAGNDSVLTSNVSAVLKLEIMDLNISNLTGIEDFTELTYLDCGRNQITNLNTSQNLYLDTLLVNQNLLTSLDISANTNLLHLMANDNNLTDFNLNNNSLLKGFDCSFNQIEILNLNNNLELIYVVAEGNNLTNLDVSQNTLLQYLACSENNLTDLDVSSNTALIELHAYENQLNSMDLSLNTSLALLDLEINQLRCLNLKNGNNTNLIELWTQDNPDLTCIEVDDSVYSTTNWLNNDDFYIGDNHYFSTNCNYSVGCQFVSDSTVICDSIIIAYDTLITCDSIVFYYDTISVYDTLLTCDSVIYSYDTLTFFDTLITNIYDTLLTNIYDTIYDTLVTNVFDTLVTNVFDTVITTIYDTSYVSISVTDTLFIDIQVVSSGAFISNTILVYPNPTNNFVIIDNGNFMEMTGLSLEIVNTVGQVVFESEIDVQAFNIPVSSIGPPGSYFIYIKDGDSIMVTKHLVLN
tara:strand:- start:504 stop:2867 length:2364 start_codon:yes stop_codon:yes gene_type:complete